VFFSLAFAALTPPSASAVVTIEWVQVGNPGNGADTATNCYSADCGSVPYSYSIAKYDTTNAQYAEFLNAVDRNGSNSLGLYNPSMSTDTNNGGIALVSANPSGSKYVVNSGFENKPVVYVTFYDAMRFANWLNNGQESGNTETGAYTLLDDPRNPVTPTNGLTVTRNPGANIFVPSENEWYKAAYYNPISQSYFAYPAGTNEPIACAPPGAIPNTANCEDVVGTLTDVGAYTGSASPYGTFDQGGNVYQWNEQMVPYQWDQHLVITGSDRGLRGGSWSYYAYALAGASADLGSPTIEGNYIGFRVASISANGQSIANAQALDCGTGPELAMVAPLLMWLRSKRRHLTP
jgi:formylglycine-generating enzyme required for sulfatase activity